MAQSISCWEAVVYLEVLDKKSEIFRRRFRDFVKQQEKQQQLSKENQFFPLSNRNVHV